MLHRIFQLSGWLVPSVLLIVMCVLSSLSATLLCDAIARIDGNSHFEKRMEFSTGAFSHNFVVIKFLWHLVVIRFYLVGWKATAAIHLLIINMILQSLRCIGIGMSTAGEASS